MRKQLVAESNKLSWYVLGRDTSRSEKVIDTNEYVLVGQRHAMVLDPGGTEIFPAVVSALSDIIDVDQISAYFCSHQDPDIMSSLPLWMGLTPKADIYVSWVWAGFIAHFGQEYVSRFQQVPDEGLTISLDGVPLQLVPAHYCHSSGNFSLFDPDNRVLFSGDIGAALMPASENALTVTHFDNHIQYMEGFHKRWMPSNRAKNDWIKRVRKLDPRFICPQHGAIFEGPDVGRFLDWFEALQVGSALTV